jgi:hypothetical protein
MKSLFALAGLLLVSSGLEAQDRIEDNSFLIEEAYNQERGVVQHISAFAHAEGGDWEYSFTQEWPFLSQHNQVSFTLPLARLSDGLGGTRARLGDIGINYRRQLLGVGGGSVALSPRLSLLLPTGDEKTGHGSGGVGVQANIPLSVLISRRLVTHYNAGFTLIPSARNTAGDKATSFGYHLGASAIILLTPRLNVMVEGVWGSTQQVVGGDLTSVVEEAFLNPGIRYAFNTRGGLQIVPGIAYTIGIGPSGGENGVFLYLSLEHAFSRAGRSDESN